ncbi:MAG: NfeD family protein [Nitrospinota bacterium]
MCHIVLAMPILGLVLFPLFPLRLALPLYSIVLLLSAGLYFLVFRAMTARVVTGKEGMIGKTCRTLTALDQEGKVKYGNEVWFARSDVPVEPGEEVLIVGFRDLVLVVEPASRALDITG